MSIPADHEGPPRRLVRRVWWIVLVLVAGLILVALQADRESDRRPGLAALVPDRFRSFALPHLIQGELQAGRSDTALAMARQLVRRRPVPAENLSILAIAALNHDDQDLAVNAIDLSAARGWREPFAQMAAARAALEAGQPAAAAQRAIALWSIGQRGQETAVLLAEISESDQGRSEIGRWLLENERARDNFLKWGALYLPPAGFGSVIGKAQASGAGFDCTALADATYNLLNNGSADAARAIWAGPCTKSSAGLNDAAFEPIRNPGAGYFGWETVNGSRFSRSGRDEAGKDSPNWTLSYDNGKPGWTLVAFRISALEEGAYRAAFVGPEAAVRGLPVQLRIACIDGEGKRQPDFATINANEPGSFLVPGEACDVQAFRLVAPRGRNEITGLAISRSGS